MTAWRILAEATSLTTRTLVTHLSVVIGERVATINGVLAEHVRWMRLRGMSPQTVRLRTLVISLIERHAGRDADKLTEDDLDAWQGDLLASPVEVTTRATYAEQAKGFFRWAHKEGHLPADPSVVLVVPRRPRRVPEPISEKDLASSARRSGSGSRTRWRVGMSTTAGTPAVSLTRAPSSTSWTICAGRRDPRPGSRHDSERPARQGEVSDAAQDPPHQR